MLAENIAYFTAAMKTYDIWQENLPNLLDEKNRRSELCHGLSSASKAFNSWSSHKITLECRRACGGHGFSHFAIIGQIAQGNDINQTWEGDNSVLLQQTAKFILWNLQWLSKGKTIQETCEYLTMDCSDKLTLTDHESPKVLLKLITARACELAHKIGMKIVSDLSIWDKLQHFDIFAMTRAYY